MASLDYQVETLELINTEISGRLTRQTTAGNEVDTKAALLAGVPATATQFLATRKDPWLVFAVVAYSTYGLSFLTAVAAYALARYTDVPNPRALVEHCVTESKAKTLAHLLATRVNAYEANMKKHRRKVIFWWISVVALTLGLVSSVVAIVHTASP